MADAVAVVADRLDVALSGVRTVFRYAVPEGDLPDQYVLVMAAAGTVGSTNLAGQTNRRSAQVDVKSVATDAHAEAAAREAGAGAERVVGALTDWRPIIGQVAWLPTHIGSFQPTRDDDSLPAPVFQAVERYVLTYQP